MNQQISINKEGTVCYIADCPEEPNHLNYKYQNEFKEWLWKSESQKMRYSDEYDKYTTALAAAKQNAVPFEDQDHAEQLIIGLHPFDTLHPFPSSEYRVEIKTEPIACPDGIDGCEFYHTIKVAVLIPLKPAPKQQEKIDLTQLHAFTNDMLEGMSAYDLFYKYILPTQLTEKPAPIESQEEWIPVKNSPKDGYYLVLCPSWNDEGMDVARFDDDGWSKEGRIITEYVIAYQPHPKLPSL